MKPGAVNFIRKSTDNGVTWTTQDSGTTQPLWGAAWDGSQFVVVGNLGTILTSPDGVTWTPRTSGTTAQLSGIVWRDGQFVTIGSNRNVYTSPDGIAWSSRGTGVSASFVPNGISWTNGLFALPGSAGTLLTRESVAQFAAASHRAAPVRRECVFRLESRKVSCGCWR